MADVGTTCRLIGGDFVALQDSNRVAEKSDSARGHAQEKCLKATRRKKSSWRALNDPKLFDLEFLRFLSTFLPCISVFYDFSFILG